MTTTADRRDAAPAYTTRDYTSKYKVVGTRSIRHDGLDKVTGRAKYGADTLLPGLLHAKVLRSPHAHARILFIDTSKALAMPGVRAVMTADDLPIVHKRDLGFTRLLGDPRMSAESVIASKKAIYRGHAVAAVAAASPHEAEEALDKIEVKYEVLPAVFDVRSAMADDAPIVHETMTTRSLQARFTPGTDTGVNSNIASHLRFERGDLDSGFADAVIDTVFVEVPNVGHPFGLRGVGEVPVVPPAAAIANAVYHATGIRMQTLPMSPTHVLEALRTAE